MSERVEDKSKSGSIHHSDQPNYCSPTVVGAGLVPSPTHDPQRLLGSAREVSSRPAHQKKPPPYLNLQMFFSLPPYA